MLYATCRGEGVTYRRSHLLCEVWKPWKIIRLWKTWIIINMSTSHQSMHPVNHWNCYKHILKGFGKENYFWTLTIVKVLTNGTQTSTWWCFYQHSLKSIQVTPTRGNSKGRELVTVLNLLLAWLLLNRNSRVRTDCLNFFFSSSIEHGTIFLACI